MLETFRNAWKIEDLRKKILFTVLIIAIYRIGCAIPVPFVDASYLSDIIGQGGSMLGYLDMITGGSFANATIFALSITPYINASIIINLLTIAIPALERLSKEGEPGKKKLAKITRYAAVGLAVFLAIAYYFMLRRSGGLKYSNMSTMSGWLSAAVIVSCFVAGACLIIWLSEQIDKKGIGNVVYHGDQLAADRRDRHGQQCSSNRHGLKKLCLVIFHATMPSFPIKYRKYTTAPGKVQ